VQLGEFTAARSGDDVHVEWTTITEIDHAGFWVLRAGPGAEPTNLTPTLIGSGAVGGEIGGADYAYVDEGAPTTTLRYWLEDVDRWGTSTRHGPVAVPPTEPYVPIRPPAAPKPLAELPL
jgi:hypothetical protein